MALNLFGNVYAGRRVLVTGHTGFKGSWLTLWLRALGAQVAGLALDPDTQPSHWTLLAFDEVSDHRVDLRDAAGVRGVIVSLRPEIIFHLAAQPLVRRGYRDPVATFDTNVTGLLNLLEAVRAIDNVRVLVNATTDKVYAQHPTPEGYRETDPLGAHDPYSTSKACAELVSDCYRKSFFDTSGSPTRVATARAGNVIGGGDWAEDRLVPDLVRAATSGQPLKVRNPAAVRPWQHVLEPLSGYLRLGQLLWNDPAHAGAWNFGPGGAGEVSVQSLAERLAAHWPALRIEHDSGVHPHEAAILRLNCDKATQQLAWRPVWNIDTALARTADWYRGFQECGHIGSSDDLASYTDDARRLALAWTA
ncbi:MAG: CDP-glucose 4,6-dehydratase [Rhodanobacteraceae bacterium]